MAHMKFNDQDRAALRKLDDFSFSSDNETASLTGEMEVTIVRPAVNDGNHFLLTIKFPGGELFDVKLSRAQLLEQLDIERDADA